MTVRKWNRRKWRWRMCSPLALPPWCFTSGCLGSMLWETWVSWGPWKAEVKMLFEETDSSAASGVPPSPDRTWCWAFQVWFLGKGPGWRRHLHRQSLRMVPGISYTSVQVHHWKLFFQAWQNPRATESMLQAPLRGMQCKEIGHLELYPICFISVSTSLLWAHFGEVTILEHIAGGHS